MSARKEAEASERRFQQYLEGLGAAVGHADRRRPLEDYLKGLLLPGERKSVEPMAARLAPDNVRQWHQSLHHLVATSPWKDEAVMEKVLDYCLPVLQQKSPITVWVVDDTGIPKKGNHSVGVARQYCGQLGKQENCQVAVSVSVGNGEVSIPVAYRLYLPEMWANDRARRKKAEVPAAVRFQTKPQIALDQIRKAVAQGVPLGVVVTDAAYGNDSGFRKGVTELGLLYMVTVQSTTTVWPPGQGPLPPRPRKHMGRPPTLLRRDGRRRPVSVEALACGLPTDTFRPLSWREGTKGPMQSRFAAVRVRPAHRDYSKTESHPEEWLLIEWPKSSEAPVKYWLSTLPADTPMEVLVDHAQARWRIERDYEELKQELGLGHYEGRNWRGFHHHATLCIAAYAFLAVERVAFPPSGQLHWLGSKIPPLPEGFAPRGASAQARTA